MTTSPSEKLPDLMGWVRSRIQQGGLKRQISKGAQHVIGRIAAVRRETNVLTVIFAKADWQKKLR